MGFSPPFTPPPRLRRRHPSRTPQRRPGLTCCCCWTRRTDSPESHPRQPSRASSPNCPNPAAPPAETARSPPQVQNRHALQRHMPRPRQGRQEQAFAAAQAAHEPARHPAAGCGVHLDRVVHPAHAVGLAEEHHLARLKIHRHRLHDRSGDRVLHHTMLRCPASPRCRTNRWKVKANRREPMAQKVNANRGPRLSTKLACQFFRRGLT